MIERKAQPCVVIVESSEPELRVGLDAVSAAVQEVEALGFTSQTALFEWLSAREDPVAVAIIGNGFVKSNEALEIVHRMRQDPRTAGTPIAIVASLVMPATTMQMMEARAILEERPTGPTGFAQAIVKVLERYKSSVANSSA